MARLIAIVGMTGSGKSTAAEIFAQNGYKKIRFGDVTDEELRRRGMRINEENESTIRETLRLEQGMDAYAKLNEPKLRALSKQNVVIDGLYSWQEYIFLKPKFPHLTLLAIYASPATRYKRLSIRDVRPLTKEEASSRDKAELENLNKAEPIAMADYTLINECKKEEFTNLIKLFIEDIEKQKGIQ